LKTLLYSDASVFERREEGDTVRGEVVCLEKENLGGDESEEARKRREEEDPWQFNPWQFNSCFLADRFCWV